MTLERAKTIAVFPGQGSQYIGMSKDLLDTFPLIAKPFFEKASEIISQDLKKLTLEGPEENLRLTKYTQPVLLCHSLATFEVLKREFGLAVDYFAGHSLGEYSALVASEKIDYEAAIKTVFRRGQAMQDAVPLGVGKMAAILGLDCHEVKEACREVEQALPREVVEVANDNCPGQVVVAGTEAGVVALEKHLVKPRVKFVFLPVSAPFHCSLMGPAAKAMRPVLAALVIVKNSNKIISNFDASLYSDDYHTGLLVKQIDHQVRWTETLLKLEPLGVSAGVEVGAGKVLSGLVKRTLGASFQILNTDKISTWSPAP